MKRIILTASLVLVFAGLKAQNCEALMLPYFGNDAARMAEYQQMAPSKFAWRCAYARTAFYESDTVPDGADLFSISEVVELSTGNHLSTNLVVDLATFSVYAYDFKRFQLLYPTGDKVLCFITPSSTHPYLVLRSIEQILAESEKLWHAEGN